MQSFNYFLCSFSVKVIFCIFILNILFQCTISQPVSEDLSEYDSNNPRHWPWSNQIFSSESVEENSDNNENNDRLLPNSLFREENSLHSPVRRANFWKRANFWRKRANFWKRDLTA